MLKFGIYMLVMIYEYARVSSTRLDLSSHTVNHSLYDISTEFLGCL